MEVERREWKVGSCTRLSAVRCRGAACRSWRCTADSYWVTIKWQRPPSLSLRGRSAPVAISGRHSQPVQAAVKMEKAEIWGVAALTAQPLAALPPYGCAVSAATDAIGAYRFHGGRYGSAALRRARLSPPLQRANSCLAQLRIFVKMYLTFREQADIIKMWKPRRLPQT